MRMFKPIMTMTTYKVRNAWMGEQLTVIACEKPWRTMVDNRFPVEAYKQLPRWGYFTVRREPMLWATEYARWFVWVPVKAEYLARRAFFSMAGVLYRAGFFHFACANGVSPQWRDVRLGPRS